jgi:hypothetical protein
VDASTATAAIAAVSAAISAVSAWNARRSALASESTLRETSRQQIINNVRQRIGDLARVYDDSMALVESLARDLQRDQAKVQRCRDALQRSVLVAGLAIPSVQSLVDANGPLTADQLARIQQDLQAESASLHALATGATPPEPGVISPQTSTSRDQ